MEEMERLFDSCDRSQSGIVPVSSLLRAVKNEIDVPNSGPGLAEKLSILESVQHLLDPLGRDTQVDKVTWCAAWEAQAEANNSSNQRRNASTDLTGSCDSRIVDVSNDDQSESFLDQSRHSYSFSPGSHTSSMDSEPEEMTSLKHENSQLRQAIKSLKDRCQNLEDSLCQAQSDRDEERKTLNGKIYKLTKKIKEREDDLKTALDVCEKEKLQLCQESVIQREQDRLQKQQLLKQKDEIDEFSGAIEKLNSEKESLEQENIHLKCELQQQSNALNEQINEYQKIIDTLSTEKLDFMNALLGKRDVAARLDEINVNNLQRELNFVDACEESSEPKIMSRNDALSKPNGLTSTSSPISLVKSIASVSLFEEIQAAVRWVQSDQPGHFDQVFELPANQPSHDNVVSVGKDAGQLLLKTSVSDGDSEEPVERSDTERLHCSDARDINEKVYNALFCEMGDEIKSQSSQISVVPLSSLANQYSSRTVTETSGEAVKYNAFTDPTQTECLSQERGQGDIDEVGSSKKISHFIEVHTVPQKKHVETQTESPCTAENKSTLESASQAVVPSNQQSHVLLEGPVKGVFQSFLILQNKRNTSRALLNKVVDHYQPPVKTLTPTLKPIFDFDEDMMTDNDEYCSSRTSVFPEKWMQQTSQKSAMSHCIPRYRSIIAFIFTFLFLVMACTIFCTAAILEIAAEAGVLYSPYFGAVPHWMKRIIGPFVHISFKSGHSPM